MTVFLCQFNSVLSTIFSKLILVISLVFVFKKFDHTDFKWVFTKTFTGRNLR